MTALHCVSYLQGAADKAPSQFEARQRWSLSPPRLYKYTWEQMYSLETSLDAVSVATAAARLCQQAASIGGQALLTGPDESARLDSTGKAYFP